MDEKRVKVKFKGQGTDFEFHGNFKGDESGFNALIGAMKKAELEIQENDDNGKKEKKG